MSAKPANGLRHAMIWVGLGIVLAVPMVAAVQSPLLAWREPIYILGGLAGIAGLLLLLVQPLLIMGALPGLRGTRGRRMHRVMGLALVGAIVLHVGALWITSPPDVIDALLLRSPTPFSIWGVAAMWAVFAVALLARFRRKLRPKRWQQAHIGLTVLVVGGTVVHALLIDGTMEDISKLGLCALTIAAAFWAVRTSRR